MTPKEFKALRKEVMRAYADCNDESGNERNLNYRASVKCTLEQAITIMSDACPGGYNGFDPVTSLNVFGDVFGPECEIRLARESSPCVYVTPRENETKTIWLNRDHRGISEIHADEISYECESNEFRIWWD